MMGTVWELDGKSSLIGCLLPMYGISINKLPRGQGRERKKLDGVAKRVGRLCVHSCAYFVFLPAFLSASGFQGAGRQAGRQNPGLSQSCALNPKRQRSALLVLSLPTNKDTQGFGGWRKCTSPEPSILPSKLRPNFSIVIIIALARGGYVISHSCFFFFFGF
jgi:hypothetical protein